MALQSNGPISFRDINAELYREPSLPFSLSFEGVFGTSESSFSYSATLNFGPLVPLGQKRYIIVATHGCREPFFPVPSSVFLVNIGGQPTSLLYRINNLQDRPTELWYIENNTLTSGPITVFLFSGIQASFGISVWRLTNPNSIIPTFTSGGSVTSSRTNTRTITVPQNGAGLCLCSPNLNNGSVSWVNAVEQYEQTMDPGQRCSGAITTTPGTYDITSTCQNPQDNTLVLACWEPMNSNINTDTRLEMNSLDFRKLAAAGNTGQSLTQGTNVSIDKMYGNARYNRNFTTPVANPNIVNDVTGSNNYRAGKTWISYSVLNGGIIGSTSTSIPALTIPNFSTSGDIVDIIVNPGGYIVGAGGDGGAGNGRGGSPVGSTGSSGGTAIQLNTPTLITNYGVIGGGGGGGGGGNNDGDNAGGGGGGGAGIVVGLGGASDDATSGDSGDLTDGGDGGSGENSASNGGRGGNLGQSGEQGSPSGFDGGAAGVSISGTQFVTYVVEGDIRGPTVF